MDFKENKGRFKIKVNGCKVCLVVGRTLRRIRYLCHTVGIILLLRDERGRTLRRIRHENKVGI